VTRHQVKLFFSSTKSCLNALPCYFDVQNGSSNQWLAKSYFRTLKWLLYAHGPPCSENPSIEADKYFTLKSKGRFQWSRGLRRSSATARLLRLWVRLRPEAWIFFCCACYVLSGRGLCDELIPRPEESYRVWCVVVCDLETSWMRRPWPTGGCCTKKKLKEWNKFINFCWGLENLKTRLPVHLPWNMAFKTSRKLFRCGQVVVTLVQHVLSSVQTTFSMSSGCCPSTHIF